MTVHSRDERRSRGPAAVRDGRHRGTAETGTDADGDATAGRSDAAGRGETRRSGGRDTTGRGQRRAPSTRRSARGGPRRVTAPAAARRTRLSRHIIYPCCHVVFPPLARVAGRRVPGSQRQPATVAGPPQVTPARDAPRRRSRWNTRLRGVEPVADDRAASDGDRVCHSGVTRGTRRRRPVAPRGPRRRRGSRAVGRARDTR